MSTDFSSIDRLIEFGMGMSLAQQMVNTMNHAMNNMQVAGVNAGTTGQSGAIGAHRPDALWYAAIDGRQAGPMNTHELETLVGRGLIEDNTLVWRPGMNAWQMACNVPEINKMILLGKTGHS